MSGRVSKESGCLVDVCIVVATICALNLSKYLFGETATLWISLAVLTFCLGVIWGADNTKRRLTLPSHPKDHP